MTGIGNYQFYLLSAFLKHSHSPEINAFNGRSWQAVDEAYLQRFAPNRRRSKYAVVANQIIRLAQHSDRARVIRYSLRKRAFEKTVPTDLSLFHAFGYLPPGRISVSTIPVVYDLSFVRYPETHPAARLRALENLGACLQDAPVIHTISNFSAREISEIFNIPVSRIAVIYPGVNPLFLTRLDEDSRNSLAHYSLEPDRYFLTVATLEPRKNLRTLVVAQAQLPYRLRQHFPMCVVGAIGWGKLNLPKGAHKLEREGSLRFLGYVPNAHLRELYRWSRATFYPSLYEGFGMPVTEALACGARLVCSNSASLPEAGGNVARYVAPLDVDGWTKEIRNAADAPDRDPETADARRRYSQHFNWDTAAAQMLELYQRAAI